MPLQFCFWMKLKLEGVWFWMTLKLEGVWFYETENKKEGFFTF